MLVGVLGKGSVFCSSVRGRGGVDSKAGVPGASDWSVRVGVAQGEPYGVELSDMQASNGLKRRFFKGVGNSDGNKNAYSVLCLTF